MVFDSAQGKPVVHTRTEDLSVSGAAIFSEQGDLTGSLMNLLLAYPAGGRREAPKVLKVLARVVSTVRTPGMAQYRHGLSFIRSPNDGLDALELFLSSAATAAATQVVPAAGSRLEQLAQKGAAEGKVLDPQGVTDANVSDALARAYRYLKDLAGRLNAVHPAYRRGYGIAGVPEFSGLVWENGDADFQMREVSPVVTLYEQVSLRFRLSGNKPIRVAREYPAAEKLERLLDDSDIKFHAQGIWNKRGSLERTTFEFPCEVAASLWLLGQFDTGRLLLRTRNVSGFGSMEQILAPEAITEESLDELTAFILGESGDLGPQLLRGA